MAVAFERLPGARNDFCSPIFLLKAWGIAQALRRWTSHFSLGRKDGGGTTTTLVVDLSRLQTRNNCDSSPPPPYTPALGAPEIWHKVRISYFPSEDKI